MSANPNIVIIVTAENKAGQVLQQIQEQTKKTEQTVTQSNTKVAETTQKVNVNTLQAAAGFASLGAGAVSLATSFDNLERAQLRVDITQKNVLASQASVIQAQEAYNKTVAKFGPDSEQVQQVLLRLQAAQQQVQIAQDKSRLAQDNLSDTYANFAAGIAPQVISLTFGMQTAFKALGITSVSQLIPSIVGVGTAMKTAFLSPPPIGLIIAGVATVVILLATNAGGLRDAVVKLGEEIFRFIQQHLRPLADLLSWLNDNVVQPLARTLGITAVESTEKAEEAFSVLQQETINLGHGIGTTADQLNENLIPALNPKLTDASNKVTQALTGVEAIAARNVERFGAIGRTALQAGEEMTQASAKTVVGLSAIEDVLKRIQDLQGQSAGVRGRIEQNAPGFVSSRGASGFTTHAAQFNAETRIRQEQAAIEEQIAGLTRMAQSLALATGKVSPLALFGGGTQIGGLTFSPDFTQGVTDFGTLISRLGGGQLRPSIDISITDAILRGLTSNFDVGGAIERLSGSLSPQGRFSAFDPIYNPTGQRLTREQFFALTRAQHGIDEMIYGPKLYLAGEAGPEHVKITPSGKNGAMKLIVQIIDANGNELGSSTLDEANAEGVIRIKTRGVRLF